MTHDQRISASDISSMLAARIDSVVAEVLPRGRREGHEWVEASTSKGGLGDSLRVRINGARAGVWSHFANNGAKGDALDLVAYVLFSGDKKKAIEWSKARLGLSDADPVKIKQERQKARKIAQDKKKQAADEVMRKRKAAQSMWHGAQKEMLGTPVDLYLAGRGIDLRDLPHLPGAIRFHPNLRHPSGGFYPAMVCQVNNERGEFIAVHRTYLDNDGHGGYVKAAVGNAKLTLGSWTGGFVSLNRGHSAKPFNQAPEGDTVVLAEGIEDALSIAVACPDMRVLAVINVGNFKNLKLPKAMSGVVIAADNDDEFIVQADGSKVVHPARKAVQAAIDVYMGQGRAVMVAQSPNGKDFNDCQKRVT